jgi:crossover junction endodeoxyribonuclease RusA
MTVIILPLPPSANRMWRMVRGKVTKSPEYRAWKSEAAWSIAHQTGGQPPLEHYRLDVIVPATRRDPDNHLKAIGDALQAGGAIRNDKLLRALTLVVDDARELASVRIELTPADGPAAKPRARKAKP